MDLSLIAFMERLIWIPSWFSCALFADLLGFSIAINDHMQAGLRLDSVWIRGGFAWIRVLFFSGCNKFSSSRKARAEVWAHSEWIRV